MPALREVFRRSSLSNEHDRVNLLAHPEALELSDLAVTQGRTRAAVAGDHIIGFASWALCGDTFELEDLFVDPDSMRQGVARALVQDVVARARDDGIRQVEVTANPHALGFYTKVGFVVGHEVETTFGPGFRMRLTVPS